MAQARDLSSMHAPMFGLGGCLNFFGQGSRSTLALSQDASFHVSFFFFTRLLEFDGKKILVFDGK